MPARDSHRQSISPIPRFSKAAWNKKFKEFLTEENRYVDMEQGIVMYRGAAYCLCCRDPVMTYQTLCPNCKDWNKPHDHSREKGSITIELKE